MKYFLSAFVLLAVLGCASSLKPGENIKKNFSGEIIDETKRSVVVILPFRDLSDGKKYPVSRQIGQIVYNGIYNVIGYIPSFDVPDKRLLNHSAGLTNRNTGISDFIISGDYRLKGSRLDPSASVRLMVWSRITGDVFTNVIKTKTDADIFDAVDAMVSRIVKLTLKEEARFALLQLDGFKPGREKFDIYVNRKYLSVVTNDSFSLGLKVLPDRPYQVTIVRTTDWKEVLNTKVSLPPSGITNIGYAASGKVRYELVAQKDGEPFQVFLDEKDVTGTPEISPVESGKVHVLRKYNVREQYSYQTRFMLRDGEVKTIPLYNQERDLYDLDKDSAYIQFEKIIDVVTNDKAVFEVQLPRTLVYKGNITGSAYQLNGYILTNTESNSVHFWCQSDKNTGDFKVILSDRDGELFLYQYKDVWSGTKKRELPFSDLKPFVWQQSEELNGEIDYPIDSLYFNNGRASFSVSGIFFNRNEMLLIDTD